MDDALLLTLAEAKSHNTVTEVIISPLMMLKSSRLYADVALFQKESLRFRSMMELHELLMVAETLLDGAVSITGHSRKLRETTSPRVDSHRCDQFMKLIREHATELTSNLAALAKRSGRSRKNRNRRGPSKAKDG